MNQYTHIDLKLSKDDRRIINGRQVGQLFFATLRAILFIAVFVGVYLALSLSFKEDVPLGIVTFSLAFAWYFEFLPMLDLTKEPKESEYGYIVKMTLLGWEPVYRRRYGHSICIAFKNEEDMVPWAFDLYLLANTAV